MGGSDASFHPSAVVCHTSFADWADALYLQPFLDAVGVIVMTTFQLPHGILEFVFLLQCPPVKVLRITEIIEDSNL